MQFGLSTACLFPELYIEDAIHAIGALNINTTEVFFSCLSEYKPSFVTELRSRVQANGIKVYSVHAFSLQFEPQLFTHHMRSRRESEDIFRQVLEAGAMLGAGVYVFHGPVNLKRSPMNHFNYDEVAQRTDELADIAAQFGIKLAWENVHYCWYERPEFAREMLRRVQTDNLYFTLDVKQAAQAGFEPVDFLPDTAGRLVNIHLCDYVRTEEGTAPRMPFSGEMDFAAFRQALAATGYDAGMMLEVYRHNYHNHQELADIYAAMCAFFS